MLPLAAAMMLTLLVLCWCCFSATRLHFQSADRAAIVAAEAGVGLSGVLSDLPDGFRNEA
ncbi:Uncharacterised protein [Raoultella planticola]|uniref:Uncharacterized protein n=1 Tax=Raoultella planticola TaxID=575 RepID=A0A485AXC1_RAOPL|nr:Uncharacterised protein [Raoultella planticola]